MKSVKSIIVLFVALAFVLGSAGFGLASPSVKEADQKLEGGKITAVDGDASTITVESDGETYVFEVHKAKDMKKAKVGRKIRYIKYYEDGGKLVATKIKYPRKAAQGC